MTPLNFLKTFLFSNTFRLRKSCKKLSKEFPYFLHPASPKVSALHGPSTTATTKMLTLALCYSLKH